MLQDQKVPAAGGQPAVARGGIAPRQMKAIFGLAKGHGLSHEDLRDMAEQYTGARSVRSLSKAQANRVISRLSGRSDRQLSTAQERMIRQLFTEIGWAEAEDDVTDSPRVRGFLHKRFRSGEIKMLSPADARTLITILKKMKRYYGASPP